MRWPIGIGVFLSVVVGWNMFFTYMALQNPDPIEKDYLVEANRK